RPIAICRRATTAAVMRPMARRRATTHRARGVTTRRRCGRRAASTAAILTATASETCRRVRRNGPLRSEGIPGRAWRKAHVADAGPGPGAEPRADRRHHPRTALEQRHARAADEIGRAVDAGEAAEGRVRLVQVVDQEQRA